MSGKTEEVYNILKNKIIQLELPPQTEITEELLGELGVSKTPLREAILELEREGFVKIRPRKATVVSEITEELLNQIYEIRLLIEPYIAKTYFMNIDIKSLKEIKNKLKTYKAEKDPNRTLYMKLDNQLHSLILNACTNTFLFNMMTSANSHNIRIRKQTTIKNEDYIHTVLQHIAIIEAIEIGNPEAIEAAVKFHILWGRKEAKTYLLDKK